MGGGGNPTNKTSLLEKLTQKGGGGSGGQSSSISYKFHCNISDFFYKSQFNFKHLQIFQIFQKRLFFTFKDF